ncbi:MAG: putative toxin-antitoxin system toxin component, PIN family [Deltaproteobacteria bacterium]|nr:putative toxin-antitoxin system toxin component, PIN family [Deltaproteobacteria bacterium]MBW1736140.1 putative toxin-antitoxin system toxin component, PIN family [Deltaproteobacteria bacterium]MBW1908468.1 putative toxin-antitoxin system toxin component, PIN family [Deltaproteobacteria bacterium]MBW2032519.1 putative toxin-antitoxin system toxin component, PIN family [Deltaproteobacteria bacterium]MBW2113446.1 putative toxin-antitoxin system toxin component, PIN family [Deltaproteobacteria
MKQLHIVLDTNILISGILFGGKPRAILEEIRKGNVSCSLSPAILDELQGVLQRPKFGFSGDATFQVVEELHAICDFVFPRHCLSVVRDDPDDNRILECAIEAKADVIVSGDPHLLNLGVFRRVRILSPAHFLRELQGH